MTKEYPKRKVGLKLKESESDIWIVRFVDMVRKRRVVLKLQELQDRARERLRS